MENPTIVAIATPLGSGGVSIVRVSGAKSLEIASQVFSCHTPVNSFLPRMMYLGTFHATDFDEQCLTVYFKAPYSFTGEDVVEFQCHGGRMIANGIVETVLAHGAQIAQPGEFSKRAFINGKLSLDQAEGIMDMINATSQSEIRSGYQLLNGHLQQTVQAMQDQLTNLLARIEVTLDYPEEDIEEETTEVIQEEMTNVLDRMNALLKTKNTGQQIREGITIAIVGKPNAGKSSLMNAFLGYDRAIVTNIQGTTRDTIEETYLYQGVKFHLIDTAGIRDSLDVVEKIGIEKSWESLSSADIILVVLDGSTSLSKEDEQILHSVKDKEYLIILNKNDLPEKIQRDKIQLILDINKDVFDKKCISVSAINKNIEKVKQQIYTLCCSHDFEGQGVVLTNLRHISCLEKAKDEMEKALEDIHQCFTLDIVSADLKSAWLALGDITGNSQNESIITEIFEKFCVGK